MKSYGIQDIASGLTRTERCLESLDRKGFEVVSGIFSEEECDDFTRRIRDVYLTQETDFGKQALEEIRELNIARMPFMYDEKLMGLFMKPEILDIVSERIGQVFQIHLQNAIINKGNQVHHQSSWHRDLPYQNWVISKPIAVNAFVCLTDFTPDNGATYILPYSHHFNGFPSEEYSEQNKVQLLGKKGDVIFFDSMCFHQAGFNETNSDRIGINNMFVAPIIKQQIDLSNFTISRPFTELEDMVLGKAFSTPQSVGEYRSKKASK